MWWLTLVLAGGAGTALRYATSRWVGALCGDAFPWGTLAVNALGSFAFGLVWVLAHDLGLLSATTRGIVLVGFMGAFTTFSTFAFETGYLLQNERWGLAAANLLAQNVLALAGVFGGVWCGRLFD